MTRELYWTDTEEIGIRLHEKFSAIDPLTVRFTDLHRHIATLEGFADDPLNCTEARLEAIQMAWLEEFQQTER